MRFYECNCNKAPGDYDAVGKRKGVEPDFSYSDKIVVPKIFNLANKPPEKTEKNTPSNIPKKISEETKLITTKPRTASSKNRS